ncbi:MAG: sulfatase-like hydrolase/transferase [Pseudomonadota bacterium]
MLSNEQKSQNQQRHYLRIAIRFFTYLLGLTLAAIAYWVTSNFGRASLEQVLYHAQFGMEGLVTTDVGIVRSFILTCLALPISITFLLLFVEYSTAMYVIYNSKHWFAKPMQIFNVHGLKVFYWFISHRAPLYTLIACSIYFAFQFSISAFVHNQLGPDYFGEHYVNPRLVKIEPVKTNAKPKNLVLIYVESLEDSYKDEAKFGKNLLSSLDALKGVSFSHYKQAPGTNWTIAGITATQCGVPLKTVSLYGGNDQGEKIKAFLPNAVCLGDVLHDAGYHNVYMGGDALSFSGKGKFFQDHHYDEVYGREELKNNLTGNEMNYWGLYDDDLLVLVKAKLKELHAQSQPFNLTFTTIDTHGPDGHFSKYCKSRGVKEFKGIVECTATQVVDFMQFMKKNGYLKDTNVVIIGDHLAMYNPTYKQLDKFKQRYIYNRFISNTPITKNRENILHFDLFPTILEFIGLQVKGGKLGLGFSAISQNTPLPPATIYEDMNEDLLNNSEKYLELWQEK